MKIYGHLDGVAADASRAVREIIELAPDPETGEYPEPGRDIFTAAVAVNLVDVTAVSPRPVVGWIYDPKAGTFSPAEIDLGKLKARLSADVDAEAEGRRLLFISGGAGQAMVYLQKQTQAAMALVDPQATATKYPLLAAEVGVTVDPQSEAPAADVVGVARAVAATVQAWLPIAAAIEGVRLRAKAAIAAATTSEAARTAAVVVWPSA